MISITLVLHHTNCYMVAVYGEGMSGWAWLGGSKCRVDSSYRTHHTTTMDKRPRVSGGVLRHARRVGDAGRALPRFPQHVRRVPRGSPEDSHGAACRLYQHTQIRLYVKLHFTQVFEIKLRCRGQSTASLTPQNGWLLLVSRGHRVGTEEHLGGMKMVDMCPIS